MNRTMQVSDSVVIRADAETIWNQVADPTQMPRWSPENTGAVGPEGGRPLNDGEVFNGTNHRGRARWITQCVVIESVPKKSFAFEVRKIGPRSPILRGGIARWAYGFEEVDGGTRVTETWTDQRTKWPDWLAGVFDRAVTGGKPFADFQRKNIQRTLATMKAEFEQAG
ncbi:SRPBCC family protein [Rothia uropygialis]|uniref:SRPBCC family protein n=1 Tax=Kocuria sp. 36 TaxID=1415402 RepID=UPI00101C048E|nr:SRPBCC family protein [Kocuria sp. 36]